MDNPNLLLIKLALATPWLIWLSVCDCKRHELPNRLTFGGAAVMAAVSLAVGLHYFLASLITAFLASLFLLLPFFLRAAGAGDVKMLFTAGLTAGPGNTLNLILLVSLAGLILAVVMLLTKRVNSARLKHYLRCLFDWRYDRAEGRKSLPSPDTESCRVPFGVAIAAGLWCNLLIQLIYTI
jgi:prepilin peptidase CpaA